ncbi:type II toxin-antitoxin system VapC family toxin [Brevundimonas sp.]|uniref:type II toxin-antitoxin system VapC family toxin n=1 Tax=Brevundimonas sp. TaxID=1871086 RepID=UPI002D641723|nr:type II toxin-antitoxin system VapC family toxin [Brevundimonas sp.]HYC69081.1 type II toxin-antitoxin system VapC family toxin [Brevundimonas sp.]
MILYLDASAVVAVVAREPTSSAVDHLVRSGDYRVVVSDFAIAEISAAIARIGRVRRLRIEDIENRFAELDGWLSSFVGSVGITSADIAAANDLVRIHDLKLRAPDAIHLAAAQRQGATLATLDNNMARAAATLDVPCINPADVSAL